MDKNIYSFRCKDEKEKDFIKKELKIIAVKNDETIADVLKRALKKLKERK